MIRNDFKRILQAAESFSRENDSDTVLFLGHPSDPIPRALLLDKDLTPWARCLWWYLRTCSDSPASAGSAPNYDTIQLELGMKGRGTVAAAIHALRVTRWITLMPHTAAHRRHIYLLHNAPLTYHEAVELDPDYPNRIAEALRSPSKPIRILAQRILDGAMLAAQSEDTNSDLFRLAGYAEQEETQSEGEDSSLLNGYMFHRSAAGPEPYDTPAPSEESECLGVELDFHVDILGISPSMEKLARTKLEGIPAEYRQPLLDDLAVRAIEGEDGSKEPLNTPLGYIMWAVNRYIKEGDLALTGKGEQLAEIIEQRERQKRARHEQPTREELQRLYADMEHYRRLESRSGTLDESLLRVRDRTEQRITELRAQLSGGSNGAS